MTATPKPATNPDERQFLQGPQARGLELRWAGGVFLEFIRGFRGLHFAGPCVTVFGSARFQEGHRYYELARQVGSGLAGAGFTVMTGAGPGIMEAANRGAKEAGGYSVGCSIQLPEEQGVNQYLDRFVNFHHFFVRKVMLVKYSYAFIALPGGFGTMDEIFEAATLIQTKKIKDFPIVLIGTDFWRPVVDSLRASLLHEGTIAPSDLDSLHLTDSPEEAVGLVRDVGLSRFSLTYGPRAKRRWFFRE